MSDSVPCDYCGERPAVGEAEDRDDSVGYHDTILVCERCAKK